MNRVTIYRAKCLDIVTLSFTEKLFPLQLRRKKHKIPDSKNEAKQN